MRHPNRQRRRIDARWRGLRAVAVTGSAALVGAPVRGRKRHRRAGLGHPAGRGKWPGRGEHCHLANGVKHVVQIGFDNVHFFRDNPNVPSDLEMVPNLLHFLEATARSCRTATRR